MAEELDQQVECLCCGKMVRVSSKVWESFECPAALCPGCAKTVPQAMVRVLYLMRSQIRSLYEKQDQHDADIKRLYQAQEELEQLALHES